MGRFYMKALTTESLKNWESIQRGTVTVQGKAPLDKAWRQNNVGAFSG
jgi:hypothetical protein